MLKVKKIANMILPHVILITGVVLAFGTLTNARITVAQVPGGGFNISVVMFCTCGAGYLALIIGVGSTMSGLFWFGPGTLYWTGTGFGPASWLGFYTPGAGVCSIYAGVTCTTINGSLMNWYGGSN